MSMKFCTPLKNLLVSAFILPSSLHATILLNDTFSDGDHTNASLPDSAAWFLAGSGVTSSPPTITSTVSSGALVNTGNSTFALAAAFASPSGRTLAIGETLRLTFDVILNFEGTPSADAFRFGIFDSKGSQISENSNGTNGSSAAFNGWRGYSFWSPNDSPSSATTASIRKRIANQNVLFSGGAEGANSSRSTTAYTNGNLANGTTYQGVFTITNTGTSFDITASLGDTSLSYSDNTASPVTTFDSIAFFAGGTPLGPDGSFILDNVMVEVVPEPSTLLLGAIAPLLLLRRRR